ncbi:MAG: hypothetical protein AAFQ47_02390 [Pseudomonadota bacterium]
MSYLAPSKRLSSQTRLSLRSIGAQKVLSDVFADTAADAAAVGFVLAHLPREAGTVLWAQDRLSEKEAGQPYMPGIGVTQPVMRVNVSRPSDVLVAMEDALRCKAVSAVIGEIWGDPPTLDFTATKRLALRAEANGVPCWLIRRAASPNLSAARNRWRIASLPSAAHPHDAQAPGDPRWQVELFRSRAAQPGIWAVRYDRTTGRLDFSAASVDRAVDTRDGADRQRAAR